MNTEYGIDAMLIGTVLAIFWWRSGLVCSLLFYLSYRVPLFVVIMICALLLGVHKNSDGSFISASVVWRSRYRVIVWSWQTDSS